MDMEILFSSIMSRSNLCLITEMAGSKMYKCKKGFYIIGCNPFPCLTSDGFDLFHKFLCVSNVR